MSTRIIDDQTVEFFFNVNIGFLPSDGLTVNGQLPSGGYNTGSTAHSITYTGDHGDIIPGLPWALTSGNYDGTFAGGLSAPDQSGTI